PAEQSSVNLLNNASDASKDGGLGYPRTLQDFSVDRVVDGRPYQLGTNSQHALSLNDRPSSTMWRELMNCANKQLSFVEVSCTIDNIYGYAERTFGRHLEANAREEMVGILTEDITEPSSIVNDEMSNITRPRKETTPEQERQQNISLDSDKKITRIMTRRTTLDDNNHNYEAETETEYDYSTDQRLGIDRSSVGDYYQRQRTVLYSLDQSPFLRKT
ncbi:9694_t:CDS:2, partial [Paraglomus brasilianum]